MIRTTRVLATVGLVTMVAMAATPAWGASVVHTPVAPQSVSDLLTKGYFVTANGRHIPVTTSNSQAGGVRPHVVRSRGVISNAGPLGVGTANGSNVRANQDFGAFVPHQTVSIAEDPLNQTHLTVGAEDARLGVGLQGNGTAFQTTPNSYSGFYDTKDGGKTYTDGLVQNIANDPGPFYFPSELGLSQLGGFNDSIHGHYSFSDDPRLAFDKYGDLFYSSIAGVTNTFDDRNGLNDVLVTRSSAYQNTGTPLGGGPCTYSGNGPLTCSFDNPFPNQPSVSAIGASAGRFFDGTQLPPVPNTANPLPAGIPYVVDTNDSGGVLGADFNSPPWVDDAPVIAVDNRTNGSQAIYVAFIRFDLAKGTADLYYSFSTDGGNTFSPPMNIDPVSRAYCISVNPIADGANTCDANEGPYIVVDGQGNPSIVFENFSAQAQIALPNTPAGFPNPYSDVNTPGFVSHQLLMVTCTQNCAGGGAPNWGANEPNGATFISSVVDVAGSFNFGEDLDHGAIFGALSYPSASVNPRDNSISVVWSDARATERSTGVGDPGVRLCSVSIGGAPISGACGGARVWEATASLTNTGAYSINFGPSEVWPLTQRSADNDEVDQLFPTVSQSLAPNPSTGVNTYVSFYTRYNVDTQSDPYGFGVENSNLNYTLTRNTFGNQSSQGEAPEIVNVNTAPMPLPLVNNGQRLTKYTQSVADTGGDHMVWVDTRASPKNFNFNGAEDVMTAYIH